MILLTYDTCILCNNNQFFKVLFGTIPLVCLAFDIIFGSLLICRV